MATHISSHKIFFAPTVFFTITLNQVGISCIIGLSNCNFFACINIPDRPKTRQETRTKRQQTESTNGSTKLIGLSLGRNRRPLKACPFPIPMRITAKIRTHTEDSLQKAEEEAESSEQKRFGGARASVDGFLYACTP